MNPSDPSNSPKPTLAETLSRFADRLFLTGGADPGDAALAVPPERLAVYHELVGRNYRSMLRFAHTATFRIVAHEAKSPASEETAATSLCPSGVWQLVSVG